MALSQWTWEKITWGKPNMEIPQATIMETITHPDDRGPDPRPGRERFYRRYGHRWMRVVIADAAPGEGEVVTAFWQRNEPEL